MNRRSRKPHIGNDSVNNNQWLCVGIERVQAVHEHGHTHPRHTTARNGMYISTQLVLNLPVNANFIRIIIHSHCFFTRSRPRSRIDRIESIAENISIHRVFSPTDWNLKGIIAITPHPKGSYIYRDLDHVIPFLVSHSRIACVIECRDTDTRSRLLSSIIIDTSFNFAHRNLRQHGLYHLCGIPYRSLGGILLRLLSRHRSCHSGHQAKC